MSGYHVGLRENLDAFEAIEDEFVVEAYPAWITVGVSELAVDGVLLEVRAIATARNGGT